MHLWGQEFCFKIAYFININIDMFFVYSPYSPLYHQSTRMNFWGAFHHLVGRLQKNTPKLENHAKLAKLFQDSKPITQGLDYIAYIMC